MRRPVLAVTWALGALVVVLLLAACAAHERGDHDGVDGPVIAVQGWNAYPSAEIIGRLTMRRECLLIDDKAVAFWATGTTWDERHQSVLFEAGTRIHVGDAFSGGGGYYRAGDVAGLDDVDVASITDCMERTGTHSAALVTPR